MGGASEVWLAKIVADVLWALFVTAVLLLAAGLWMMIDYVKRVWRQGYDR